MIKDEILDNIMHSVDMLSLHMLTVEAKIKHQGEELPFTLVKNLTDIGKNLHAASEALQDRGPQNLVVRFTDSESKPQDVVLERGTPK